MRKRFTKLVSVLSSTELEDTVNLFAMSPFMPTLNGKMPAEKVNLGLDLKDNKWLKLIEKMKTFQK